MLVGTLRYAQHRSLPDIHQELGRRRIVIAPRTVQHLVERYETLMALSLRSMTRLHTITQPQGRVILALDGLQTDVGPEVLWVVRDCLSTAVLLARRLLSATQDDLATLLREVKAAMPVPIVGLITDGQHAIRAAVQQALPDVSHRLCHFTLCARPPSPSIR
jgi:hypothetical protein